MDFEDGLEFLDVNRMMILCNFAWLVAFEYNLSFRWFSVSLEVKKKKKMRCYGLLSEQLQK